MTYYDYLKTLNVEPESALEEYLLHKVFVFEDDAEFEETHDHGESCDCGCHDQPEEIQDEELIEYIAEYIEEHPDWREGYRD